MDIFEFQDRLGIHFNNSDLLMQAVTHRSYINEQDDETLQDNERLEFLGDAVLDFLITGVLFERFPEMPEGELTRLRAALVRTETLADVAMQCHLGDVLRMGRGEETSGGRLRRNNLCDGFEALLGAMYLDQGQTAVRDFVLPLLLPLIEYILEEGLHKDARSMLQEWSQAEVSATPTYRVVTAVGPDHDKIFTVEVLIDEQVLASGDGRSKQTAAQAAARQALKRVEAGELQLTGPATNAG